MELLAEALLVLHFIGLASLLGGFLVQVKDETKVINMAMFHGVLTQLVTGIALVGLAYPIHAADPAEPLPDNAKFGVKLVILLVILGLVLANRAKASISTAVWGAIGGLTVMNIVIAVFWN